MRDYLEALALSILAVFAPIKPMMLATGALIVADLITGVWAAKKRKEPITSSRLKRTVGKFLVYELALCMSYLVHQYLVGDILPAEKIIAAMIGLVELKSCLENMDAIQGESVFKVIIDRVVQAQKDQDPK